MTRIFSAADISASGLTAERIRMEVVANNLANAYTTETAEGGPYRRQEVVFSSVYDQSLGGTSRMGGVEVVGIQPSDEELPRVYNPDHPHADDDGFVTLPNVQPAMEMVDLLTASRSYEANLRALRAYRQMAENALSLLRGA